MACNKYSELISLCIDNELKEEKKKELLNHLEECDECKKEYDELLELRKELSSFVKESDRSISDEVMKKIKKTPFIFRHIGLAASLVFIVLLAVFTMSEKDVPANNTEKASVNTAELPESAVSIKNSVDSTPLESDDGVTITLGKYEMPPMPFADEETIREAAEEAIKNMLENTTITIAGGTEVADGIYKTETEEGETIYVESVGSPLVISPWEEDCSEVTIEANIEDVINNLTEHYISYTLFDNIITVESDLFSLLQILDFTPTKTVGKGQRYVKIIVE